MASVARKRWLQVVALAILCMVVLAYTNLSDTRLIPHRQMLPNRTQPLANALQQLPAVSSKTGQNGSTTVGAFHQISDREIYIYSGFWDHRFQPLRVRLFGMQKNASGSERLLCNFYFTPDIKARVPVYKAEAIYPYWPSHKLKYLAHYYECKMPQSVHDYRAIQSFSLGVEGQWRETFIPLSHVGLTEAGGRRDLAICVKGIWGNVDPYRLVEWVEFNLVLGVQKVVFYDTTTVGEAARVLEHYVSTGTADVIQYNYAIRMSSLMHDDPMRRHLANDGMMLEQTYLVSTNDCLYRYRDRYKYIAVIDLDEIIVPSASSADTLPGVINRALSEFPKAASIAFSTAWHFEEYGSAALDAAPSPVPAFLHMQNHLRRSPVVRSQPKCVVVTDRFITVNWHSVIVLPVGMDGNKYVPWQEYACVHHFRNRCKYDGEKCQEMLEKSEVDDVIPRYGHLVKERVEQVLTRLYLL